MAHGRPPLWARIAAAAIVAALGVAFFLVHVCADGGAMAAAYQTCGCRGIEWELYDRTAADGPRRTACLGLVSKRTCYLSRGGREVPCPGAS